MGTVIVGIRGPLLAADQPNIAEVFGVDVQQIGRILGSYITLTLVGSRQDRNHLRNIHAGNRLSRLFF